jgi:hypothetical protein
VNRSTVKQTDDIFYKRHPELVDPASGRRRPLTMGSADRALRQEWMAIHHSVEQEDKQGFAACDVGGTVQACPAAAAPGPPCRAAASLAPFV